MLNIPVSSSSPENSDVSNTEQLNEGSYTFKTNGGTEKNALEIELNREDELNSARHANNVEMQQSAPEAGASTTAWHDTKELITVEEGNIF